MRAGRLRHFVEVQEPDLVDDSGHGGQSTRPATEPGSDGSGWRRRGDTWVAVEPMSSREVLSEGRIGLGVTHMVRARDTWKIDQTCRLKLIRGDVTKYLHVIGIQHVEERGREVLLTCEERA